MTARKQRPKLGDEVEPGMSLRDIACCLGRSTAWLTFCMRVAEIPRDEFEAFIESDDVSMGGLQTLAYARPVPRPGRVERAFGIYKAMTPHERGQFLALIGGAA